MNNSPVINRGPSEWTNKTRRIARVYSFIIITITIAFRGGDRPRCLRRRARRNRARRRRAGAAVINARGRRSVRPDDGFSRALGRDRRRETERSASAPPTTATAVCAVSSTVPHVRRDNHTVTRPRSFINRRKPTRFVGGDIPVSSPFTPLSFRCLPNFRRLSPLFHRPGTVRPPPRHDRPPLNAPAKRCPTAHAAGRKRALSRTTRPTASPDV